jgi:transcriptional regulator with XRE-family HTH domain
VKRLRAAVGLTQVQLAERIGVTQGFITNLETDRKGGVSVALLYKLSDALEVTCDHWRPFLGEQEEGGPDQGKSESADQSEKKPARRKKGDSG